MSALSPDFSTGGGDAGLASSALGVAGAADAIVAAQRLRALAGDCDGRTRLRRHLAMALQRPELCRLDDHQLLALAAACLSSGRLAGNAAEAGDAGTAVSGAHLPAEQEKALRTLRQLPQGEQEFRLDGRILRIVSRSRWGALRDGGIYEVVSTPEAGRILQVAAARPALAAENRDALLAVIPQLPDPNQPQEYGLMLLRRAPPLPVPAASSSGSVTPSQLAGKSSAKENHWVEIELKDEDGNPVSGVNYLIVTADNQEFRGATDGDGGARLDGIVPGNCRISFPDLDQSAWKAA